MLIEDYAHKALDEALIEQWEAVHETYWRHRNGMAKYAELMRELAPEYTAAVWRERARWDEQLLGIQEEDNGEES